MGRQAKGIKDKELAKLIYKLSKNLHEYRTSKGLTLQELATYARVATSTVWELENGKAEDLRLGTITAIAEQLDIDPLKLLS